MGCLYSTMKVRKKEDLQDSEERMQGPASGAVADCAGTLMISIVKGKPLNVLGTIKSPDAHGLTQTTVT